MTNRQKLRNCISSSADELIIYGADNFAQFPHRNGSIRSSCDRALPAAAQNDLVVLRGTLDREYHNWLRAQGLGPDCVVEYKASSGELSLSEIIVKDPEPILKIIRESGRKPIYVPWYSGRMEAEAALALGAELFGASEEATLKYNDKANFKTVCRKLDVPVVAGDSFVVSSNDTTVVTNSVTTVVTNSVTTAIHPKESAKASEMARIVTKHLATHENVIIRGTLGESGMSLYKTAGGDLADLYKEIAASGEKMVLIEPFLRVISTPNDQWVIDRNEDISHLGLADQICERGMVHIGTEEGHPQSQRIHNSITHNSLKIVKHMAEFGYRGVLGIDYIVTDGGIFPVENNARFNGSTFARLIVNNIEKLTSPVAYWKFIKIKTTPCLFSQLIQRIENVLYDGKKTNSVFPYNCDSLSLTGDLSVILLAEDWNHLTYLEQLLLEMGVKRE